MTENNKQNQAPKKPETPIETIFVQNQRDTMEARPLQTPIGTIRLQASREAKEKVSGEKKNN